MEIALQTSMIWLSRDEYAPRKLHTTKSEETTRELIFDDYSWYVGNTVIIFFHLNVVWSECEQCVPSTSDLRTHFRVSEEYPYALACWVVNTIAIATISENSILPIGAVVRGGPLESWAWQDVKNQATCRGYGIYHSAIKFRCYDRDKKQKKAHCCSPHLFGHVENLLTPTPF